MLARRAICSSLNIYAITGQVRYHSVCAKPQAISAHTTLLPDRQKFPWYIPREQFRDDCYRQIFSPLENRLYPLPLPNHCSGCKIIIRGSTSDGYLFIFNSTDRPTISMFNPFTSSHIQLPPLPSHEHSRSQPKLIESDDGFRILMFGSSFLCCRPGDSTWTEIDSHGAVIVDFAYYKGKIFLEQLPPKTPDLPPEKTDWNNKLVISDPADPMYRTILGGTTDIINPTTPMPQRSRSIDFFDTSVYETFFVQSSSGEDLFMVGHGTKNYKKDTFEIFRVDTSKEHPTFLRVKSIGNDVLFVDHFNAMCFAASNFERCRGNCIYFLNSYDSGAGLFHIGDGTIENLPWDIPEETLHGPWVVPGR